MPKDRARSDIQEEIHNIETLLQEADTLQDRAQKCKYTQRIAMIISKAKAKLLTKFWDDTTEKDTLWDILEHATSDNTRLLVRCIKLDQDEEDEDRGHQQQRDVYNGHRSHADRPVGDTG